MLVEVLPILDTHNSNTVPAHHCPTTSRACVTVTEVVCRRIFRDCEQADNTSSCVLSSPESTVIGARFVFTTTDEPIRAGNPDALFTFADGPKQHIRQVRKCSVVLWDGE